MKPDKPKNIEEYKKWLKDKFGIVIDAKTSTHYNSVSSKIKTDFEASKVWTDIIQNLNNFNNEYLSNTGYQLLINEFKPEFVTKSFSSFFEKSFRKNIVLNNNWPDSPDKEWILPNNWFEKTNDILRTYFVVKYLDGVDFLMEKIIKMCKQNTLNCNNSFEARDEGYYAVHLYTKYQFEIPKLDWDTENKSFSIEMQITTQLQDVISKLTHQYYEDRRIRINKTDKKWQWNYASDEFTVNYLGHILHYLEGMIMDVRQKQSLKK